MVPTLAKLFLKPPLRVAVILFPDNQNMNILRPLVLDPFCLRQFGENAATRILYDPVLFTEEVNKLYKIEDLKEGYAPFCKHLFIPNFTDTANYTKRITPENEGLLRTAYKARTQKELPVLQRYFPRETAVLEKAKFLDIILYSKEQIQKENEGMSTQDPNKEVEYDYGIISVKPQDVDHEIPMLPITMMRNALGVKEGGSGVELDREKYQKAVEFWSQHALVE